MPEFVNWVSLLCSLFALWSAVRQKRRLEAQEKAILALITSLKGTQAQVDVLQSKLIDHTVKKDHNA